jgi:hypothetical protein
VTYDLSHAPALATGPNTFVPSFFVAPASVVFSSPTVVVPAGGQANVNVTITVDAGLADKSVYGGYLVVTPQGGGGVVRVPYAGFKGDYQSIQVLTSGGFGFPLLGREVAPGGFDVVDPATSFTMTDAFNIPNVLVHLDHQSRRLVVEVLDAATGKSWHNAIDMQYVGRNSTSTGFFALPIDGITMSGKKTFTLPNGTYLLKLSVLKALAGEGEWNDENNSLVSWETWASSTFIVARP